MLNWFARLWAVEVPPQHPDVIVPLDYGHFNIEWGGHISSMSRSGLLIATEWLARCPDAILVYANSSHSHAGSDVAAAEEKAQLLLDWKVVSAGQEIDAGGIENSVAEAEAVKKALLEDRMTPKEILVITGPLHSRSARFIWGKIFPGVRISLVHFPVSEWQRGNQFWFMRERWRWTLAAILRHTVVRIPVVGLYLASKAKHRGAR